MSKSVLILITLIVPVLVFAGEAPRVGRKAAARYFEANPESNRDPAQSDYNNSSATGESLLMIHAGAFTESTSYKWQGDPKQTGIGKATYGVTYLYDHWGKIDTNIRLDFIEFKLGEDRATKLSLMPLWTFPMAETRFPLYFGFGAGVGIFFTQIEGESNLSLDYQLLAGARFLDIIDNLGAFVEYGLKNHLHLLSDGQYNSTALSGGVVFTF
jgi:hypothetical protein